MLYPESVKALLHSTTCAVCRSLLLRQRQIAWKDKVLVKNGPSRPTGGFLSKNNNFFTQGDATSPKNRYFQNWTHSKKDRAQIRGHEAHLLCLCTCHYALLNVHSVHFSSVCSVQHPLSWTACTLPFFCVVLVWRHYSQGYHIWHSSCSLADITLMFMRQHNKYCASLWHCVCR